MTDVSSSDSGNKGLASTFAAANNNVLRWNKLMATTPGADITLMTAGYTFKLLSFLGAKASSARLSLAAARVAQQANKTQALLPGEALILTPSASSKLVRTTQSLGALSALCSDYRMFMRLVVGLPRLYAGALAALNAPAGATDPVLRAVSLSQMAALLSFQACESTAYLASKGVLAMEPARMIRLFRWSARWFLVHVSLEFVRLWRSGQISARREGLGVGEKEDKIARQEEAKKWWESLVVNAAWWPLALHWSGEGLISEGAVAVGTLVAANYGVRRAWAATK